MKFIAVICGALVGFASSAADPNPIPPNRIAFFERTERERERVISHWQPQADAIKKQIAELEAAVVDPKWKGSVKREIDGVMLWSFPSDDKKKAAILEAKDRLDPIVSKLKPAINFKQPFREGRFSPHLVGDSGILSDVVLEQKVSDSEGLIRIHYIVEGVTATGRRTMNPAFTFAYIRGFPLKDTADGQRVELGFIETASTHTYASSTGPRTVPLNVAAKETEINSDFQRWIAPKLKAADVAQKHAAAAEAQAIRAAKSKVEEEAKAKATVDHEKKAADKLNGAKFLHDTGSKGKAKDRLREVMKDFPGTKAAKEAEELVSKW